MLVELVNDENVGMILDELKGYCTDVNPDTAQAAILAIGRIGRSYSDKCLEILTGLLGLKQDQITSAVVQTIRDLVWVCPQCSDTVSLALEGCEEVLQDNQGRQALLWLLGVYGERISSAPYTLEAFIDGVRSETSMEMKMELLTSTMRLFLCRPAETQDMLGRLLHYCIEEERDMCVRSQALLYYRLLQCGIEETRSVLQGRRSDPSMGVLIGRPPEPISQWVSSFNTLEPLKRSSLETESASRGSPQHLASIPKPNTDLPDNLDCGQLEMVHSGSDSIGQHLDCPAGLLPPDAEPSFTLSLCPTVSPEEFERLWMQEPADDGDRCLWREETIGCTAVTRCSPQSLHAAMQLVNIQTLAFTPSCSLPWKVFLYTHTLHPDTSGSTLILGELLYTGEANRKCPADGEVELKDPTETMGATAAGDKGVKVTLRQQPPDVGALRVFFSVLTTVLHTLSSEMA